MKLVSVVFKCPDNWMRYVGEILEDLKKMGIKENEIEYHIKNWRDWNEKVS